MTLVNGCINDMFFQCSAKCLACTTGITNYFISNDIGGTQEKSKLIINLSKIKLNSDTVYSE